MAALGTISPTSSRVSRNAQACAVSSPSRPPPGNPSNRERDIRLLVSQNHQQPWPEKQQQFRSLKAHDTIQLCADAPVCNACTLTGMTSVHTRFALPEHIMPALCRDCLHCFNPGTQPRGPQRCPSCRSPRIKQHDELFTLSIAHMDCDAFYASVEKRDNPELADKPVIIGGGHRGVVSTACYVARIRGVRSAMPMFQALKLCPMRW